MHRFKITFIHDTSPLPQFQRTTTKMSDTPKIHPTKYLSYFVVAYVEFFLRDSWLWRETKREINKLEECHQKKKNSSRNTTNKMKGTMKKMWNAAEIDGDGYNLIQKCHFSGGK